MISKLMGLFVKKQLLPEVTNRYHGIVLMANNGNVYYDHLQYLIELLTCDIMNDAEILDGLPITNHQTLEKITVVVRYNDLIVSNTHLTNAIRGHNFVTHEYHAVIGRERKTSMFNWVFDSETKYNREHAKSELVNYLTLINRLAAVVKDGERTEALTETNKNNRIEALKTLQFNIYTLNSILKLLKEQK